MLIVDDLVEKPRFTVGSLFDGSGGFPLAAVICGGIPVWASEIEPYPIAVTKSRFPHMKHLGSVTDINGAEIDPVDVITFGSPCQDLSVAGKRAGLKHEANGDEETTRSGLFMEAVRIIKEMRRATNGVYPKIAVWENVPGAFSSHKGEDFRVVLEELIKICEPHAVMPSVPRKGWAYADHYRGNGWSIAYRTFDAQYWGVPQRRRRIYLVLDLTGQRAGEILFERDGLRGYFTEGRSPWQGVTADAQNGAGATDYKGSNGDSLSYGFPLGFRPENIKVYEEKATTICNGTRPGFTTGVICVATQQGGAEITENDVCPTITAAAGMSGNNQPWICKIVGCDFYNQTLTGNVAKTLTGTAVDKDHIPCVLTSPRCFRKTAHPRNAEEGQGWEPTEVADTLNVFDTGEMRTPILAVFENHSQDSRYKGPIDVSQTVSATFGMGGNNQPFIVEGTIPIQCIETFHCNTEEEKAPPLKARDYKDPLCVTQPCGSNHVYIVRRLTPTECARLQGFADQWSVPDKKSEFSDHEYLFWLNVRNTHAAINGKRVKEYTKKQMLTWYNKLHTDSAEYKLWGNGIAFPNALYVMQGIGEVLSYSQSDKIATNFQ